jgi:hypothetical protein
MLAWAINPYDETMQKEFKRTNLEDKYNWSYRSFEDVIALMNAQQYGILGIAHPARELERSTDNPCGVIAEEFALYKKLSKKNVLFTEVYYQPYKNNPQLQDLLIYINDQALKHNIIRTGSCDTHGKSIFCN